ncbi:phospholipid phosphatase 3-like [Scyliorhinus canicula]|uniref:phospholipid phosphatase 3-like n=1 Tax=Scyliorhinus canicula TaxID=7830 RepID=UPI0018F2B74B|nr:phospholipid phosphatase 3-like [Scyliorhinus canicula]
MSKCKEDGSYTPTVAIVRIPDSEDAFGSEPEVAGGGPRDHRAPRGRRMLIFLDMICIVLASLPFFMVEFNGVTPYRRGFYCDDESISYPHKEEETISDPVLCTAGILITVIAIVVGESYRVRFLNEQSRSFVTNPYVSMIYKQVGSFLFGCAVSQSLTDLAKVAVGRLRPHFLDVCRPDFTKINCSRGYIEDYDCRATASAVTEARKSFYSGHASFAMYTLLYLAFYLEARFTWKGARLLRPLLQSLLVMMAFYTGLSRVSDYRHHPSDVLVGFLQGVIIAYWIAFHISEMFKSKKQTVKESNVCADNSIQTNHTTC